MDGRDMADALGRRMASYRELSAANWETTRVRLVRLRYGLPAAAKGDLTFAAFLAQHPSFPVFLGAMQAPKPLDLSPALLLPALLSSWTKTPLAALFAEFEASFGHLAGDRPRGLIVNHRSLIGGLILYDAWAEAHLTEPAVVRNKAVDFVTLRVTRAGGGADLAAASFLPFLAKLAWTPDDDV